LTGHGGSKQNNYDVSQKVAAKMTEAFREAHATHACSDCAFAGLQNATASDKPPRHPVELLWQAYGLERE
jgi:Fe-S oxidoreductase